MIRKEKTLRSWESLRWLDFLLYIWYDDISRDLEKKKSNNNEIKKEDRVEEENIIKIKKKKKKKKTNLREVQSGENDLFQKMFQITNVGQVYV